VGTHQLDQLGIGRPVLHAMGNHIHAGTCRGLAALDRLLVGRAAGGKVADVADTRFHHVLVAQVLVDGLGLGR